MKKHYVMHIVNLLLYIGFICVVAILSIYLGCRGFTNQMSDSTSIEVSIEQNP